MKAGCAVGKGWFVSGFVADALMAATFNERSGFRPWGGFETNDSICTLPGGFADDQRTPAVPGACAGVVAILRNKVPNEAHLIDWQNGSSPGEQNGVPDRLCYSRAQTFSTQVAGPAWLSRLNQAQSRPP